MTTETQITNVLRDLKSDAPAGYALAFHVRFTTPTFLFQTYPKAWADYYSSHGLVMHDPTVAWGFENTGSQRWSNLTATDTAGVMSKAAEYGLRYGVTIATESNESRSLASFAREDREFTDAEIAHLRDQIALLHDATADTLALEPDTVTRLRKMAVTFIPGEQ